MSQGCNTGYLQYPPAGLPPEFAQAAQLWQRLPAAWCSFWYHKQCTRACRFGPLRLYLGSPLLAQQWLRPQAGPGSERLYAASPPSASPDASRIEASFWRWLPACMPSFFNTRRCLIPTACQMPKSSEPTPTGGSCLSKRQAIVRVLSNAARPCKRSWQGCCGLPDPRLSGKGGWS